jgi:murein L,D-transpeptidase YafK
MKRVVWILLCLLIGFQGFGQKRDGASAPTAKPKPAPSTKPSSMNSADNSPDSTSPDVFRLLVKKSERKLYLYETRKGTEALRKTYEIALGNNPTGHKQQQGDGATPEGDYYITHRNPKSNYYLSLGVSYPNISDAASGLQRGLISQQQHDAIVRAIRTQSKPLQNTRLGGDIFIHGGGIGSDWTLGCIALENDQIRELFELLPVKTKVRIDP